jgi:hypothetical protein
VKRTLTATFRVAEGGAEDADAAAAARRSNFGHESDHIALPVKCVCDE